jgi:RHS repeat-associated protein
MSVDQLGSTRVTTDQNGAVTGRFDYVPFGLELGALGAAGRTSALGYGGAGPRMKFTGKERDSETGLDFFWARYMSGVQGRFTSPDPITVTPARVADPQQLNLYAYGRNNPLKYVDPTGMIISIDGLSDKDKPLWQKVVDLANKQDANGNYVNLGLHSAYAALDSDSRVFKIEDNPSLGAGTAGLFTITKFNGENDFSEARIDLNFKTIKGINSTTTGDFDPTFQKYSGLLGGNGFIPRLAETFGHEANHGIFAQQDPAQGTAIQRLLLNRDAAMQALSAKGRYPLPPDVLQKMQAAEKALVPTERFAQQAEKIINGELKASQVK